MPKTLAIEIEYMSKDELEDAVIRAMINAGNTDPIDVQQVIQWGWHAKIAYNMLDMFLNGHLIAEVVDGEVKFNPGTPPPGWIHSNN